MPRHVQTTGQPTAANQAPISQGSGEGAAVWTGVVVNPMTTLGDLMYGGASGAVTRLTGDTSNTRKFLRELSSGGVAAAPAWDTLQAGDIPNIAESQVTNLVSDLALKAPLASPTFTGTPAAPTATGGTNTTQLATTAFVASAISTLATDSLVVHLAGTETITGAKTFSAGTVTLADATNIVVGTTTGTKIGTATTQKLGFFNATPVVQPTGDVITALQNLGLIASATISEGDVTNLTSDLAGKQATLTLTTTGTSGAATLVGATLNIPNYGAGGGMTNPMTTLGDIIYENGTPAAARLAGNTGSGMQFLTQTGTGTVSAAPAWHTLAAGDIPTLNQNTTGSAATLTTGRTIQTNLASTSSATFDGSANITPGVSGTLGVGNGGTGVGSVTIAPTASAFAGWDANKNFSANVVFEAFTTTATAAGTTTLTISSTETQVFTGTTTQTVKLPTTSVPQGAQYTIINQSTGAVTVQSSGANTITILAAGTSGIFTAVVATPTTAANWNSQYFGSVVTSGKVLSVSNTLTLAGTDATTMTFPSTSATIARTDAAQTFTGIQTFSGVEVNTNQAITVTTNAGTADISHGTQTFTNSSAAAMTITLTTGAVDGQKKIIRIYDFSAVAEGITWVNTENSTVSAPTTSNGSTTLPLTVGFMYNGSTSKWRCVAVA